MPKSSFGIGGGAVISWRSGAILELPNLPPEPVRILDVVQHPVGPILRLKSIAGGYPTKDIFLSQVLYITLINSTQLESNPCPVIGHNGVLAPYAIVKPRFHDTTALAHGQECAFLGYSPWKTCVKVLLRPLRTKTFIADFSLNIASLEFVRYMQTIERATFFRAGWSSYLEV